MLKNASISALLAVGLVYFSSRIVEVVLNSRSLLTLCAEIHEGTGSSKARKPQAVDSPVFVSVSGMVSFVKYPSSCSAVLELFAALGFFSHSPEFCQIFS